MATLVIEIPEGLKTELDSHQISKKRMDSFITSALELWLRSNQGIGAGKAKRSKRTTSRTPFSNSAAPFIDQLLDDNLELFQKLAKL